MQESIWYTHHSAKIGLDFEQRVEQTRYLKPRPFKAIRVYCKWSLNRNWPAYTSFEAQYPGYWPYNLMSKAKDEFISFILKFTENNACCMS